MVCLMRQGLWPMPVDTMQSLHGQLTNVVLSRCPPVKLIPLSVLLLTTWRPKATSAKAAASCPCQTLCAKPYPKWAAKADYATAAPNARHALKAQPLPQQHANTGQNTRHAKPNNSTERATAAHRSPPNSAKQRAPSAVTCAAGYH